MPQGGPEKRQCEDLADFGYFCVPFYQCDEESKVITDGGFLIDPRLGDVDCNDAPTKESAITSACSKLTERCCQHPKSTDICPKSCGKRNTNGVFEVRSEIELAVDDAKFGEWPHVCAVLQKKIFKGTELLVYQCGASLIEEGTLLTAAHSLKDIPSSDLIVRCGEWDTLAEDPLPYQEIGVDTIQIHPCFNKDNLHHDIALLFLEKNFQLTPHINPVCVPEPAQEWAGGLPCVSNGWGKDKFGAEGKYANILKQVGLPLLKNQECQDLLRNNTRLGPFFELDESFLCAGGQKDVDTCKGDGGSPLTCEQPDGSWVQAGIVSWGVGCGGVGIPAVYTNVGKAACWIDAQVRCFSGDEKSPSAFGFQNSQCPKFNCKNLKSDKC